MVESSTDLPIIAELTITVTLDRVKATLKMDERIPPSEIVLTAVNGPWASIAEALLYAMEAEVKLIRDAAQKNGMLIRAASYAKEGQA